MSRAIAAALVAASAAIASGAAAQAYLPASPAVVKAAPTPGINKGVLGFAGEEAFTGATSYTCSIVPKNEELATQVSDKTLSLDAAASLGLALGPSISGSAKTRVFIQDWMKTKPCTSTDGKTQLLYGYGLRLVATISDISGTGNLSLARIAAETTLNNTASTVEATLVGISDPASEKELIKLLGPMNVENFSEKAGIAAKVANAALDSKSGNAQFIGVITPPTALSGHVASTLALQSIVEGKSCLAAKQRIRSSEMEAPAVVEATYLTLTRVCDTTKPAPPAQATAKTAMMGFKLK